MGDARTATVENGVRPFRIEVPEGEIDELRRRIADTRWPSRELVSDRSQGVQLAALQAWRATGQPSTTGVDARRD